MTLKLKNIGDVEVSLYAPAGGTDSLIVEPGQVVEIPGEMAKGSDIEGQLPDALYTRTPDGELRAWPVSRWEAVSERSPDRTISPATGEHSSTGGG